MNEKELFYEADVRKHQQMVAEKMIFAAKRILDLAIKHDTSKLGDLEEPYYIDPVYTLNTESIEYGSDRYKEVTAQMGKGWEHHKIYNNHHPEFYEYFEKERDLFSKMNLFSLLEMLCDWIAASRRGDNNPMEPMKSKYNLTPQLESILENTLSLLGR